MKTKTLRVENLGLLEKHIAEIKVISIIIIIIITLSTKYNAGAKSIKQEI